MQQLFKTHRISTGSPGPHVLITAGVHGDEYEPISAAARLADKIPDMFINGQVTIVPVVNESAFKRHNRCGEDGLDLARTCPGNPRGTVTERVAFQVSELIRTADYYIDLHTGGTTLDIYPLAGYMLHSSPEILTAQRKMAEAFGLPVVWGTDNSPNGRTLSVARDANIPAIYAEFGGPGPFSENIIEEYIEGCLRVLDNLSCLEYKKTKPRTCLYWVEDHRPNSGHLQSKTPAPVAGIFIPVVKTGEKVKEGALWGVIEDPLTLGRTEVRSNADGFVLLTRVKGQVNKDDSLGGLLPISDPGKITIDEHN